MNAQDIIFKGAAAESAAPASLFEARREAVEAQEEHKKEDETKKSKMTVAGVLRTFGTVVLLGAAVTFLIQRWDVLDHLTRYYSFLGFTVALTVIGFLCGVRLKEDKSARTFLGVSAAIVPANFCALGALLYSLTPHASLVSYPSYFHWVAPDPTLTLVTIGIASIVLGIVSLISFRAFARNQALAISGAYVAANAALLIPVRDPDYVGFIALTMFIATVAFERLVLYTRGVLKTREGRLVRLMTYTPVLLVFARSFFLYGSSQFMIASVMAIATILLFVIGPRLTRDKHFACCLEFFATLTLANSWYLFADGFMGVFELPVELGIPMFFIPYAGFLLLMSLYSTIEGRKLQIAAMYSIVAGVLLNLTVYTSLITAFTALLAGIIITVVSFAVKHKGTIFVGLISSFAGFIYHIVYAIDHVTISPWMSLAVLGVLTILAGSFVERHYVSLKERIEALQLELASWSK